MSDISEIATDFESHHIEGRAAAALGRAGFGGGYFHVPLVSHVEGNLWQGGCRNGVRLPDDFKFVVSLYPWEQYAIGDETTRIEVRMLDVDEMPDMRQLYDIARIVNAFTASGKTLVHCQAGLNRSGLVAGLALILSGTAPERAIALLRERRCDMVLCNAVFESWLLALGSQELAA